MNRREMLKITGMLLGAGLSGSLSQQVLAGALPKAQTARRVFDDRTRKVVAVLAELIIPKTDTPGAIEAGTPAFIEMMVGEWFDDGERRIFFDGIAALDAFCQQQYQRDFLACDDVQRTAALQAAEKTASAYKSPAPAFDFTQKFVDRGTPFFTKLKELTVVGFFTSEIGSKQVLEYNPMPMRYDGDYDLAQSGREWSW